MKLFFLCIVCVAAGYVMRFAQELKEEKENGN